MVLPVFDSFLKIAEETIGAYLISQGFEALPPTAYGHECTVRYVRKLAAVSVSYEYLNTPDVLLEQLSGESAAGRPAVVASRNIKSLAIQCCPELLPGLKPAMAPGKPGPVPKTLPKAEPAWLLAEIRRILEVATEILRRGSDSLK